MFAAISAIENNLKSQISNKSSFCKTIQKWERDFISLSKHRLFLNAKDPAVQGRGLDGGWQLPAGPLRNEFYNFIMAICRALSVS